MACIGAASYWSTPDVSLVGWWQDGGRRRVEQEGGGRRELFEWEGVTDIYLEAGRGFKGGGRILGEYKKVAREMGCLDRHKAGI